MGSAHDAPASRVRMLQLALNEGERRGEVEARIRIGEELLARACREPDIAALLRHATPRVTPLASLTPREREVLALMAEGRSNAAIAAALFVTERTTWRQDLPITAVRLAFAPGYRIHTNL